MAADIVHGSIGGFEGVFAVQRVGQVARELEQRRCRSVRDFGPIRYDFTVSLDFLARRYVLDGDRTCFPNYEIYINGAMILGAPHGACMATDLIFGETIHEHLEGDFH